MYDEDYIKRVVGNDYHFPEYFVNNRFSNKNQKANSSEATYSPRLRIYNNIDNEVKPNDISQNQNTRQYEAKQVNNVTQIVKPLKTKSEISQMYPEIYTTTEPMIESVISKNRSKPLTQNLIDSMVSEIYDALEVENIQNTNMGQSEQTMKVNSRPSNPLLRDLLRIMLINCILYNNCGRNNQPNIPEPRQRTMRRYPNIFPYNNINYFKVPYPEDF